VRREPREEGESKRVRDNKLFLKGRTQIERSTNLVPPHLAGVRVCIRVYGKKKSSTHNVHVQLTALAKYFCNDERACVRNVTGCELESRKSHHCLFSFAPPRPLSTLVDNLLFSGPVFVSPQKILKNSQNVSLNEKFDQNDKLSPQGSSRILDLPKHKVTRESMAAFASPFNILCQ
jgi:hypothetical protein